MSIDERDFWKYIPRQVAVARAEVHWRRLQSAVLYPFVLLVDRLAKVFTTE